MKLNTKKIKTNDYGKEYKDLIEKLGFSLNPLMDQLERGFSKGISEENLANFEYKTVDIEVDASGIPKYNGTLNTTLPNFKGFNVIQVIDLTGANTRPTGTPFISFELNSLVISIKHIAALPANIKFRLVMESYG